MEFDIRFVGKNPILEIPNGQNPELYPQFEPYGFANRMVRCCWFLSVGGKGRIVQVNGNNDSRKQNRGKSLKRAFAKRELKKIIYYHRIQFSTDRISICTARQHSCYELITYCYRPMRQQNWGQISRLARNNYLIVIILLFKIYPLEIKVYTSDYENNYIELGIIW